MKKINKYLMAFVILILCFSSSGFTKIYANEISYPEDDQIIENIAVRNIYEEKTHIVYCTRYENFEAKICAEGSILLDSDGNASSDDVYVYVVCPYPTSSLYVNKSYIGSHLHLSYCFSIYLPDGSSPFIDSSWTI